MLHRPPMYRESLQARSGLAWALSLAWLSLSGASAGGCSTDALGIEECRELENARCEAAKACGRLDDVEACKRYYRDHCLHGLNLSQAPRQSQLQACVATIQSAGRCAAQGIALASCDLGGAHLSSTVQSVCELVDEPEQASSCAFLKGDPKDAGKDSSTKDAGKDSSTKDAGKDSSTKDAGKDS